MVAIVPINARQNTEQSTTSGTYVSASCETSALLNTVPYLVQFCGNFGHTSVSGIPSMRLAHGSVTISENTDEGATEDDHWSGGTCQGYALVTGNGTDTLDFEILDGGSGTCFAGAMSIVAIPFDELTEGVDYFVGQTNSASLEESNVSTSVWAKVRSETFDLPDDGNYIIMMSVESQPSALGTTSNASFVRWRHAGNPLWDTGSTGNSQVEWEDDAEWHANAFHGLETLSAGNNTFEIEALSRGSAESNYRRSRIWAVRAATFDQVIQNRDTTGATTTSLTYVQFNSQSYTPNQTEDVVIMHSTYVGMSVANSTLKMQLVTDGGDRCIDSGVNIGDGGLDSSADNPVLMMVDIDRDLSSVQVYETEMEVSESATGAAGRNREDDAGSFANLILWSMELAAAPGGAGKPVFFGCAA